MKIDFNNLEKDDLAIRLWQIRRLACKVWKLIVNPHTTDAERKKLYRWYNDLCDEHGRVEELSS